MSVSIKHSYKETDNLISDAISKNVVIIDEIVRYLTIFKANGNDLLQKIDSIIQEIHKMPYQTLTPTAVYILKWIIMHVGLFENISEFYNTSIDDLIKLFTTLSSSINTKLQRMKADLENEKKKYDDAFAKFFATSQIHSTICNKLRSIEDEIEQFKKQNNESKVEKRKKDFDKAEKEYISAEKNAFDERIAVYNSKLQLAAEEENFIVKCEIYDSQIYQAIEKILKEYSQKVKQMSKDLKNLSQKSYNSTLKEIQSECMKIPDNENIDDFNYEDTFKKLNKKYGYDDTLPKLDFNVFKFLPPQEVFKDDLEGTYFIVKQKYKVKELDEIEANKGSILKLISKHSDDKSVVRNEENGEIGVILNKNIQPISEDIIIFRQIRKIRNSDNDDPIYVLAMSEANPETHLVKCMDANGAISMINDQMLDPPL